MRLLLSGTKCFDDAIVSQALFVTEEVLDDCSRR